MTNRWGQLMACVVATVMIANLQYAWVSALEAAQDSAFPASDRDGVENACK